MALIGLHFSCEKDLQMQSHSTLLQRKCSSVWRVSGPKSDELATHSQNDLLSMIHGEEKEKFQNTVTNHQCLLLGLNAASLQII